MSDTTSRSEAGLLVVTRADCVVQNRRRDAQATIDLEATEEFERPRRPDPTDDKVNEAFKRARSC